MSKLAEAASRLQRRAGGALEVAVVLGSGLSEAIGKRIDCEAIPFSKLGIPKPAIAGHPGVVLVGEWCGKRTAVFAGRVHLYEGYSARKVAYAVRLAAEAGARILVLTNAAGGLNESFEAGDVMLVKDHLNLTGAHPLEARERFDFLNMNDAYAPHLRDLARARPETDKLWEGVYAGVRGPIYETPAEVIALRRLGADAVGMSLVLETIAARELGLDVLALSLITNTLAGSTGVSHAEVVDRARAGAERLVLSIENVLSAL